MTPDQIKPFLDALCRIIDCWNDLAYDGDRGRSNNALDLRLWDDGSGELGTWYWETFNPQCKFSAIDELAEFLCDWIDND